MLLVGKFFFVQAAIILLDEFLVATGKLLLQGSKGFCFALGIANLTPGGAGRGARAAICFINGVIGITAGSTAAAVTALTVASTLPLSLSLSLALTRALPARSRTAVGTGAVLLLLLFGLFDQFLQHGDNLVLLFLGVFIRFFDRQAAARKVHAVLRAKRGT